MFVLSQVIGPSDWEAKEIKFARYFHDISLFNLYCQEYSLAMELIMMTFPLFCSRKIGKTARQQWNTPSVLVAKIFRQSLSSKFSGKFTSPRIPAFASKMQGPPRSLNKQNNQDRNYHKSQGPNRILTLRASKYGVQAIRTSVPIT